MLGEEAESEISKVPVSNNTISRRVDDLFNNVSGILSEILQNTALHVDETTDITGKAQLVAFVRFENESEIMENYFFGVKDCQILPKAITFSTSCLLTWNLIICHGTSALESALMVLPQ